MTFIGRIAEYCNTECPCVISKDDAANLSAVVGLVKCKIIGCAPEFSDVIPELDRLQGVLDACNAGASSCQWNPNYLSSSGSPYNEILSLVTTLKFRQENGLEVDAVTLRNDLGWTEAQFEQWATLLTDGGNISVTQDGSLSLLHLDNLDGVCLP